MTLATAIGAIYCYTHYTLLAPTPTKVVSELRMSLRYSFWLILLFGSLFCLAPVPAIQAQTAQPCTVVLLDMSLVPDPARHEYRGALPIGNDFFCVATMHFRVEDANGLQVIEEIYRIDGRDKFEFSFGDAKLRSDQKYRIIATPRNSNEEIFVVDDEPVRALKEFIHLPQQAPTLALNIRAINMDHAAGKLLIDLEVTNPELASSYTGYILDKESSASIHAIQEALFQGPSIEEALATNNPIRTAPIAREYLLNLCLKSKDDKSVCTEKEFKPAPAPQLRWWQKVGLALSTPQVYVPLLVALMSTISWVLVRNARGQKSEPILRRPPIGGTDTIVGRHGQTPTLLLQVIRTPGTPASKRQRVLRFPFRIGRDGCDLNFPKDAHISKPHLEIDYRKDAFYVTDLGSTNHTYVDEQELQPKQSVRIRQATVIRLGPHTEIEVDPFG